MVRRSRVLGGLLLSCALLMLGVSGCSTSNCADTASCPRGDEDAGLSGTATDDDAVGATDESATDIDGTTGAGLGDLPTLPGAPGGSGSTTDEAGSDVAVTDDASDSSATDDIATDTTTDGERVDVASTDATSTDDAAATGGIGTDAAGTDTATTDAMATDSAAETDTTEATTDGPVEPPLCVFDESVFGDGCVLAP